MVKLRWRSSSRSMAHRHDGIARDQKSSRSTRTGAAVSISGSCEQRMERALQTSRAYPLFTMSRSPLSRSRSGFVFFLSRMRNSQWRSSALERTRSGGARRDRTADILLAKQALSQLSYGPEPVEMAECSNFQAPRSVGRNGGPGKI